MPNPTPRAKRSLVLIVDDDVRSAHLLGRLLGEEGWDVEVIGDAVLAMGRLSHAPTPDVLVTDLQMPKIDGVSVAHFARTRRPNLPVFIVTGHPELAERAERELDPQPQIFSKPLHYEEFARSLRAAV